MNAPLRELIETWRAYAGISGQPRAEVLRMCADELEAASESPVRLPPAQEADRDKARRLIVVETISAWPKTLGSGKLLQLLDEFSVKVLNINAHSELSASHSPSQARDAGEQP